MIEKVINQDAVFDNKIVQKQQHISNKIKLERRKLHQSALDDIMSKYDDPVKLRSLESTIEIGASN